MVNYYHDINSIDFCYDFSAPEMSSECPTYANDIYSLGKMIYYIMEEKEPYPKSVKLKQYNLIQYI